MEIWPRRERQHLLVAAVRTNEEAISGGARSGTRYVEKRPGTRHGKSRLASWESARRRSADAFEYRHRAPGNPCSRLIERKRPESRANGVQQMTERVTRIGAALY